MLALFLLDYFKVFTFPDWSIGTPQSYSIVSSINLMTAKTKFLKESIT